MSIRPLLPTDYIQWLQGFNERSESQYVHDLGKMDMSDCTEDWFKDLVTKHHRFIQKDEQYIFGLFDQKTGKHIGMVNVAILARDKLQWADIGYFLHNQYWKKGYGREAVKGLVTLCFETLNLHRLEAHINLDNAPSINLIKDVGFSLEGTREAFIYEEDRWHDQLVYYKINPYWKPIN